MRSKTPFLVAFILFSTLLLGAVSGIHISHAATTSDASGYSLNSAQVYNAYGQFEVNETLKGASNSTALNSITFGFPTSYQAHLVMLSANAELGSNVIQTSVSTNVSNNTLFITLTFAQSLGGANSTVSLGFWVLNALQTINGSGYYRGPVLYSPSVNIHLSSLTTIITLPYVTTNIPDTSTMQARGFAQTVSSTSNDQIWNESTTAPNSTLISFPATIYSNPTSTGSLDFTSIDRQISVDASGQILVKDTLNVQNLGLNTISLLTYAPLTNSGNLTAVPSNEPPLSNVEMIEVTGGQLSLNQYQSTNSTRQFCYSYLPVHARKSILESFKRRLHRYCSNDRAHQRDCRPIQAVLYICSWGGNHWSTVITHCFWDKSNWIRDGIAQIQGGNRFGDFERAAYHCNIIRWSFHRGNCVQTEV